MSSVMTTSKKMHNISKAVDMPTVHQNNLINSVSSLFSSSKYSDLTIHCGSDVYELHRAIICPRSDFFAAACDSGFQVHTDLSHETSNLLMACS